MKAEYIQRGDTIYITPEQNVLAGDIIVVGEKRVAVAASNINAGTIGVAYTEGVFAMPKAEVAIAQGTDLYWDGTTVTTSEGGGKSIGYAFEAAAEKEKTVAVKLPG
jgi:predicted RecA/RadA family phage recombinase